MNDQSAFYQQEQDAVAQTELWLEKVVIRHDFCPFASYPASNGLVRTVACFESSRFECAFFFKDEIVRLLDSSSSELETTLLVFNDAVFIELEDLLGFIDDMQQFLEENELDETFQLVGFHPVYQFEGEGVNARSNFTNRSPFPMIHIIREESMTKAIEGYGESKVDQIPEKNINKLQAMSEAEFKDVVLRYCRHSDHQA
jgi:uncharacterized protein